MSPHSYRQPGTVVTDHVFTVPLDHAEPDGRQIEVFAREVVAADAAGRPAVAGLPGGRPRARGDPAGGPGRVAGPGAARLPGAAAGPAGHGPLDAGQPADAGRPRLAAGPGGLPGPVPGRLDRGRRGADPQEGHGRPAVERARAELRRVLHGDLPVAGAGRAARGVRDRRAAGPGHDGRRRVPADLPDGGGQEPGALRALPAGRRAGPAGRQGAGRGAGPAAGRDAADGGGVPVAGPDAGRQHGQPHAALPAGGPVRGRRAERRLPVPGGVDADAGRGAAVRAAARGGVRAGAGRPGGRPSGSGPSSPSSTRPGRWTATRR